MKRYTYLTTYFCPASVVTDWKLVQKNFPMYRGENALAITNAAGTPAVPYNFCNTTLINYVTPAYTGVRGSLRSKYLIFTDSAVNSGAAIVGRTSSPQPISNATLTTDNASTSAFSRYFVNRYPVGLAGQVAVQTAQNPTVEVEFPYYVNRRFDHARSLTLVNTNSPDATHVIHQNFRRSISGGMHRFVSVGEDFQLYLFQGMPPFYRRATPLAG